MQIKMVLCAVFLGLGTSLAQAASVYVSDNLRVGVRPEPNSNIAPIGVVLTGMKLEVLERRENYIKIRTEKNLVGWIKSIYVVDEAPAVIQLTQLKQRHQAAQKQINELQESLKLLEKSNLQLNEQVDTLKADRSRLQLQIARGDIPAQPGQSRWGWWLLLALIGALVVFFAGVFWHRQQTMKRLGGLRF